MQPCRWGAPFSSHIPGLCSKHPSSAGQHTAGHTADSGPRALTQLQRLEEKQDPEEVTYSLRITKKTSPPKGLRAQREQPMQLSMPLHAVPAEAVCHHPQPAPDWSEVFASFVPQHRLGYSPWRCPPLCPYAQARDNSISIHRADKTTLSLFPLQNTKQVL